MEFLEKYFSEQNKLIEKRASESDKLRLLKPTLKRFDDINSLMNSFAENSTSMPAYRKKFDKLYEQLRSQEASAVKKFVGGVEGELAGKEAARLVGKVVAELSIGEKGMEYITGPECRKFIEEVGAMMELGYTAKLGEKVVKAWE
jgi:hypothetical protein